jgi:hypothetical protein
MRESCFTNFEKASQMSFFGYHILVFARVATRLLLWDPLASTARFLVNKSDFRYSYSYFGPATGLLNEFSQGRAQIKHILQARMSYRMQSFYQWVLNTPDNSDKSVQAKSCTTPAPHQARHPKQTRCPAVPREGQSPPESLPGPLDLVRGVRPGPSKQNFFVNKTGNQIGRIGQYYIVIYTYILMVSNVNI